MLIAWFWGVFMRGKHVPRNMGIALNQEAGRLAGFVALGGWFGRAPRMRQPSAEKGMRCDVSQVQT